jgi:putative tryptophan/tyrosine transport system substrate-binding protein
MTRRNVIFSLGALASGAVAWPSAARVRPTERMHQIGFIHTQAPDDPVGMARLAALVLGLDDLGWREGDNLHIDSRFAAGDVDRLRVLAKQLAELRPDVIVTNTPFAIAPVREQSHAIPIVFVNMTDPVGAGVLPSLSHPHDNITGFTTFEYPIVGKWLQLLEEIAPSVSRVGLMFNPAAVYGGGSYWLDQLKDAAEASATETFAMFVRNAAEMRDAVFALGAQPNAGLLVAIDSFTSAHHAQIASLALQHRIPGCYGFRYYATEGGLMSYGPDGSDTMRRVASYVDRILRGGKVADLPVQQPHKFELVVNLTTAKAFGLDVPRSVIVRADEVIE